MADAYSYAATWAPVTAGAITAAHDTKNTKYVVAEQKAENERTREYNLQLAKMQNEWNLQQWQRENAALKQATNEERAYNSPSAQKARLAAAGLNPDMMYGGSGVSNTSSSASVAPSPAMTAGSPAQAMDWSIARTNTVGAALGQALATAQAQANIDATKANTRKTLADAGLSETSLEYANAREKLGLNLTEAQFKKVQADYELAQKAIEKAPLEIENMSLDNAYKAIRNAFESEVFQAQLKQMAEELKITKEEAKYAAEYYAAQLLGVKADNAWKDAAWIVERANGVPTLIKYGADMTPKLLDMLSKFIPRP